MIKTIKLGLIILCMPLMAMASQFKAGEHYEELATEKSATPQVTEFFSFFCGHCYKMEPIAKAIAKSLPKDVQFVKSHVNFLGGKSKEQQSNLSFAYLVAKQLGKQEPVTDAIFHQIHRQRVSFSNIQEVKSLLANQQIDGKLFDSLQNSMPVIMAEKAMEDAQNKYSKMGALTGVPTFIVNGKYKVNIHKLKSQQELDQLLVELLAK